jgi:hypothetical protein
MTNIDRGEALAQAALEWRYSERGGVPMSAVEEFGKLLDESDWLRTRATQDEAQKGE